MKKIKQKFSYLPLVGIISVFIAGTLLDIASVHYLGWTVGGLGSIAAAITAIFYMHKYTHKRVTTKTLIKLLRLVKPQLPSIWDKLFVLAVLAVAITAPLVTSSGILEDITLSVFLYALSAAIIPAAYEELINRGFIQSSLERLHYKAWLVVMMSSLIFSFSHYPVNPDVVPITLIAGVLFGIMTIRTKSIILPFLIHGVWNFVVTLTP